MDDRNSAKAKICIKKKKNPIYHQKEHYNVLFSNYSDLFFEDLINANPAL